jgi:hypothetical protein
MSDFPTHIVETDRYGWNHGGRHRLAYGEASVRKILAGLKGRYDVRGGFTATVFELQGLEDVTEDFIVKESEDAAPF